MFEIEYSFSDSSLLNSFSWDEVAFRYKLFLGNLILKKDNNSIEINWGWVPLIDIAICLLAISKRLTNEVEGEKYFEFTESDSKITFQKSGNVIKIFTSFSNKVLEISFIEFQSAVGKFYENLISGILLKNAELKDNKVFMGFLRKGDSI